MTVAGYFADENFPGEIVRWLRERGQNVVHAAESCPGVRDETILAMASSERRIVLTFDHDFGEIVFRQGYPGVVGVVLFRIPQDSSELLLLLTRAFFGSLPPLTGFFTVVSPGRYRQVAIQGEP